MFLCDLYLRVIIIIVFVIFFIYDISRIVQRQAVAIFKCAEICTLQTTTHTNTAWELTDPPAFTSQQLKNCLRSRLPIHPVDH